MKKTDRWIPVTAMIGFGCMLLEQWVSRWSPFEDQAFLCGGLLGAGIVLMIQAVYGTARCLSQKEKE